MDQECASDHEEFQVTILDGMGQLNSDITNMDNGEEIKSNEASDTGVGFQCYAKQKDMDMDTCNDDKMEGHKDNDVMQLRSQMGSKKRWVGPDGDYVVVDHGKIQIGEAGIDDRNITYNKRGSKFLKVKSKARNKGKKSQIGWELEKNVSRQGEKQRVKE